MLFITLDYVSMRSLDYINMDNENVLYLIFNNVDGYIKEKKWK